MTSPVSDTVLFATHVINDLVRAHYSQLQQQLPDGYRLVLFYDEACISAAEASALAGDAVLPHQGNDWSNFKRPGKFFDTKVPGNEDGMLLSAFNRLPASQHYWYIEYDVAYSGDWRVFFDELALSGADLLGTNLFTFGESPDWPVWKSIETPAGVSTEALERRRGFFPVMRLSAAACEYLQAEYRRGWAGHWECLVPTVLLHGGYAIEEIGGDSDHTPASRRGRFYHSNRSSNSLSPGSFRFRPTMETAGDTPDTLWHPVKRRSGTDWDRRPTSSPSWWQRLRRRLGPGGG